MGQSLPATQEDVPDMTDEEEKEEGLNPKVGGEGAGPSSDLKVRDR